MTSVPLSDVKVYRDWKDAPPGTIVAYASPILVTVASQQPAAREGPKIAICVKSSADSQQFLLILTPEPTVLASQANDHTHTSIFGAVVASDGPALDVTSHYDLRIQPAPIAADLYEDPPLLTIIQTLDENPQTLLFAGNVGRSTRYLVLEGPEKGTLKERPSQRAQILGKLLIVPKYILPTPS
jgi:hypothetical protein